MKYTEGKVLFIVADKSCHGIPVGAKVTINEVNRSDYGFVTADNTQRWCREEEVSETNPKPLFKAGDRVVLNTTSPVRGRGSLWSELEDDIFPVGTVTGYDPRDGDVMVAFEEQPRFYALESELKLKTEEVVVAKEKVVVVVGDFVRIVTGKWAPEASKDSLAVVVPNGTVRSYFCNKGRCEVGFANTHLGDKIEKVASAGEPVVGGFYRILGNECSPHHHYAIGQVVRCTQAAGGSDSDYSARFVSIDASAMPQFVHASQIEFVSFEEGATAEPVTTKPQVTVKPVEAPVAVAPATLKAGDKVRLIVRSPFYGTGEVKFHDVGTVKRIGDSGVIIVDFPAQRNWMAKPSELELASVPVKASEPRADRTQAPVYVVVHEERQEDFLIVTEDREEARRVKTRKGGKRAGYIINLYAKVKEIR